MRLSVVPKQAYIMSIEIKPETRGSIVTVRLSGKLTRQDYLQFLPAVDRLAAIHGKLRLLVAMRGFRGWAVGALWGGIKFDMKHPRDIERLAIVCDNKWLEEMVAFRKPFTAATVRYFDKTQAGAARDWLAHEMARAA